MLHAEQQEDLGVIIMQHSCVDGPAIAQFGLKPLRTVARYLLRVHLGCLNIDHFKRLALLSCQLLKLYKFDLW